MSEIPGAYPPGAIQIFGGAVLLQGAALVHNAILVARQVDDMASSPYLPQLQTLKRGLARAAMNAAAISPERNDETKPLGDEKDSALCGDESTIDTAAAAKMLGLTIRRVQQLAPSLSVDGQRRGRALCLDRGLVAALKQKRENDGQ